MKPQTKILALAVALGRGQCGILYRWGIRVLKIVLNRSRGNLVIPADSIVIW